MSPLETEIAALQELALHDLRIVWRRVHRGEPPARLSRDLMLRAIAHRMQERAHGGLAPALKRRLRALITEIEAKGTDAFDPAITVKAGARLVREWGGRVHTVLVLDDGFDYEGERYRSLTQIAARITGAHRSGPRFFGIRKPASRPAAPAESGDA